MKMGKRLMKRALTLGLTVLLVLNLTATVFADGNKRVSGQNRYATCIQVAEALKQELGINKFQTIVVARGDQYADALSGDYLAIENSAPIILVSKGNNSEALNYIKSNLSPEGRIYILGGLLAVDSQIEETLKSITPEVKRLQGNNRYDTNLAILNEALSPSKEESEEPKEIIPSAFPEIEDKVEMDILICSGKSFPDALSASAVGKPIMLVGENLTESQTEFLSKHIEHIRNIYIIGGASAVNEAVEKALSNFKKPVRISGNTRYSTSTAVARTFFKSAKEVVMASGTNFPDGLCGGVLAAKKNAPLLLSAMDLGFSAAYQYVFARAAIKDVTILGGEKAVADDATGLTPEGEKKHGLLTIGWAKFFTNPDGSFVKNEQRTVEGETYYFGPNYVAKQETIVSLNGKNYYLKNGKIDNSVCKSFKENGVTWNVINGVATKVVSEKDKTLNRALVLVSKITTDKMTRSEKLKACFDHIKTSYPEYNPRIPHSKSMDWPIVYANDVFVDKGGNCLSFGAALCFMAKAIGYENVYACNSGGHGWAEIEGLIYDPEWSMHHFKYTYYGLSYDDETDQNYRGAIAPGLPWMRIKI